MDISGIWKPFGKWDSMRPSIEINGDEITFYRAVGNSDLQKSTKKFEMLSNYYMRDFECYDLKIEGDEYRSLDYMVHEETVNGKPVAILSAMGMEYDGRGRIVSASLIREEDADLVDENFVSEAVKFWNRRPSVSPTMIMNPTSGGFTMAMVNRMIPTGNQTNDEQSSVVKLWNCGCGLKGISSKFCPECGTPRPYLP